MASSQAPRIEAFTFGDPVTIDKESDVTQYFECFYNGKYYHTPFDMRGISKLYTSAIHLKSQLSVKRNILTGAFIPHKMLDAMTFTRLVNDFLWTGNCYPELVRNTLNQPMRLRSRLSKFTRVGKDDTFWRIDGTHSYGIEMKGAELLPAGRIMQLAEPDLNQEIYGVPDWMPAVCSAALNTEAGKFRLRYYRNGSHAGYILYMTDSAIDDDDVDSIREALKQSKGPGNFRNLFVHSPGGEKDGLKIMPISEVTAKDEFLNIKNVTRDDQFSSVRVPPQLMGVMPANVGGFGSPREAALVYSVNELKPIQIVFSQINDWLGDEVIRFNDYEIPDGKS